MNIPILIPIKAISHRCPNKNYILLPYTLEWIQKQGRIQDVIIIADSNLFRDITNKYNIKEYYLEDREWDSDLISIKKYLQEHHEITWYIHLPVTQPLREENLLSKIEIDNYFDYNIITTYNKQQDRTVFLISESKDKFLIKNIERKGRLCDTVLFADGAIYLTNRNFMLSLTDNINKSFWSGNIKFIENKVPFVDIDTKEDLQTFLKYYKHE